MKHHNYRIYAPIFFLFLVIDMEMTAILRSFDYHSDIVLAIFLLPWFSIPVSKFVIL